MLPRPLRLLAAVTFSAIATQVSSDWRYLPNGRLMLADQYLDQPQCTIWHSPPSAKRWVCTIARNSHPEGNFGEHAEVLYSEDEGQTWTTGIRLEAEGAPTNSYGNIGQTDFGRLYVVYSMNLDNVTRFPSGKPFTRDDELGYHVWRYSEDGGSTWAGQRLTIPVPNTALDRSNSFGGSTQMFWSVDQIKRTRAGGSLYAFTKIGTYMQSAPEESFFLSSSNVNTERNASLVAWSVHPQGDAGVRPNCPAPDCMQWEEAHVVQLASQLGLFSLTRTSVGLLGAASTQDDTGAGGWTARFAEYSAAGLPAAGGRLLKNPEGPITLKRFSNGKYLLLFYFNSVAGYLPPRASNSTLRNPRNPYWLCAGWEEADGQVRFSQPEVALHYAPLGGPPASSSNSGTGPGYPDFIEESDGRVFITETNKTQARVHPIDPAFLATLFSADAINATAAQGLALAFSAASQGVTFSTPPLPAFAGPAAGVGATIGLWLASHGAAQPGGALVAVGPLSLRVSLGAGAGAPLLLALTDAATGTAAQLVMDADCTARLTAPSPAAHYAAVVVDASARVLTWSVDGVVCDGGTAGLWGWEWAPLAMGDLNANAREPTFVLGGNYSGRVVGGAWYSRALMHTELVGNWRAGPPAGAYQQLL